MAYKDKETLRLYRCFSEQKYRCTKQTHPQYHQYGGRGIKFLFNSFQDWLEALGPKPDKTYSVDRINNNGNYESCNVRWATIETQSKNKRIYKTNITGVKGVSPIKNTTTFCSQINGKRLYTGPDFFEAVCRRKSAEEWMP